MDALFGCANIEMKDGGAPCCDPRLHCEDIPLLAKVREINLSYTGCFLARAAHG